MSRSNAKRIAVVAPANAVKRETEAKVKAFAAARYGERAEIVFHPQCFLSSGHFAGTDAERSAAFLEAANDPSVDAVWFGRGGYGSNRLDEALYSKLTDAARKKIFLGYSDLGFLHARLYALGIGKPVYGPMASDINRKRGEEAVARALAFLVDGETSGFEPAVRAGKKYAAFGLTILSHLIGARWAPDLSGHVIMLEEVDEHHYRIDRCFWTIMQNKGVRAAAGIMLGRCNPIPENDPAFLKTEEEIARYWCERCGVPWLGRADIGHDVQNKIVPFGSVTVSV